MSVAANRGLPALTAIASGVAGGTIFYSLGLPLAWLLGAIVGSALIVTMGIPAQIPGALRDMVLIVLGLMIGTDLDPQVFGEMSSWPVSLFGVLIYTFVVTATQYLFLRRVGRYDRPTAYFSAAPGGFMAMTVIGGGLGGNERIIAMTHAVRIVTVVFVLVFGYHLVLGTDASQATHYIPLTALRPAEYLIVVAIGLLGFLFAKSLRLPGAAMVGPLLAMALVQLTGVANAPVPSAPIVVAEVVLGSSIGAQFAGSTVRELGWGVVLALMVTIFMFCFSVVFSVIIWLMTGLKLSALFLAFAPGGMSGVSLIALALNIEPAFVAVHNLVRMLLLLVVGPILFRIASRATT